MWRAVLYTLLLIVCGCGKPNNPPTAQYQAIDASQLRPAFASSSPAAQTLVDQIMTSIQDSEHERAIKDLDALAAMPSLTETQKQVAAAVAEQLRKRSTQPGGR